MPKRTALQTGLNFAVRASGEKADTLVLSCGNLNGFLFAKPPAALDITPQAFGNRTSELRDLLRRFGLHAAEPGGRADLQPAWQEQFDKLPRYRQLAMVRFLSFCGAHGIAPAAVGDDTLTAFEAFCRERILCADPVGLSRRAASNWNWAAGNIPGWPKVRLTRPRMRDFYTLPLTAFPVSFQQDVEVFLKRMMGSTLDNALPIYSAGSETGRQRKRRKVTSLRTVETRRWQIRQLASAWVLLGHPIEELQSLRDLVQPIERARDLIDFYFARVGREQNSQVAGIAECARQIARHHCKLTVEEVEHFSVWVSNARPENDGMVAKNRERLRALIVAERRAMLLGLPQELLRRAQSPKLTVKAAARLVAYAVALEILLVFPMRRSNLASLHTGQKHLKRLSPGGKLVTHIFLSKAETKNKVELNWPIPPETAMMIENFLRVHRRHLAEPGNPYLFPGPGLKQRSAHELAIGLSKLIHEAIGVEVNLHLLRHFGAWLYLQHCPGEYEIVRQVLGHKKLSTTINCYAGLEADASARAYDAVVLKERAATKTMARAAFSPGVKRRSGGKPGTRAKGGK